MNHIDSSLINDIYVLLKKFISLIFLIAIMLFLLISLISVDRRKIIERRCKTEVCNTTDENAINIAKEFCNKLNINFTDKEPIVTKNRSIFSDTKVKERLIDINFNNFKIVEVCSNAEVVEYRDYKYANFNNWTNDNKKLIPEQLAMEIVESIISKIEMPSDMVFDGIAINEITGLYTFRWVRQVNGYKSLRDKIEITIDGTKDKDNHGKIIRYFKTFLNTKPVTNKDEAIEIAWKYYRSTYIKEVPDHIFQEIKSRYVIDVEFRYVLSDEIYNLKYNDGRLAWVVHFKYISKIFDSPDKLPQELVDSPHKIDNEERIEMGMWEIEFIIMVDALTGEVFR